MIARILLGAVVVSSLGACGGGGGGKKVAKKPTHTAKQKRPPAPKETEADREAKRVEYAHSFAAEGSTCLPVSAKEGGGAHLEIAQVGDDAVVCAVDTDTSRLAGVLACWKVDLASGALAYTPPTALPGHDTPVKLDERCARGYCLPAEAQLPGDGVAHLAWSSDHAKVAVLAGDDVHLFDVGTKAHESSFSIKGDKGLTTNSTAIHWVGDHVFVQGASGEQGANVWVFKQDGTPVGTVDEMGKPPRPLSTSGGAFLALDKDRIAIAEKGFTTLTTYSVKDGARAKVVRKLPKGSCKPAEIDNFWKGSTDGVAPKCVEYLTKTFAHLNGADALAGSRNFLVLLQGTRMGELAVMDAKTLTEGRVIKLSWCGEGAAAGDDATPKPE